MGDSAPAPTSTLRTLLRRHQNARNSSYGRGNRGHRAVDPCSFEAISLTRLLCLLCRQVTEGRTDLNACPECGAVEKPADADNNVTITLTAHELRVLTFWAARYAEVIREKPGCQNSPQIVQGICDDLGTFTSIPLSLSQEVADLRSRLKGTKVTVFDPEGNELDI